MQCRIAVSLCLVALLLTALAPAASADKMENLEKRILQLEKQNAELQSQLHQLLDDVRQQKETTEEIKQAKPLGGMLENTKIGGDLRVRGIMMDNFWNFDTAGYDDSWEWYRMRTRLYIDTQLQEDLRVYFRAANEYKWGIDSKANTLLVDSQGLDIVIGNKQLFVDNAYLEWSEPMGIESLTLKIGRQDLIYGEGFMILDGQDNVGSMAIAFDGVKTSWTLGDQTNLDLFGMKIEEHDKNFADDEDLYGAYLTDTSLLEDHKVEAYVLHRNRNMVEDFLAPVGGAGAIIPEQNTTAIGGRLSGKFLDGSLAYAMEGNYQFGEIEDVNGAFFANYTPGDDIDRRAYGGYMWGKYTFLDTEWQPYIKLGGVFTSGDDPDSSDYEGFDTFYAEWPKFSEGMIYQLYDPFFPLKGGTDGDLGAWSNMIIAQAEVGAKPTEQMGASLRYQHLWADEETGLGDDDERGGLVTAMITYNFNKYLSGHLLGDYFFPDDYYPDDADDAFFARWQLLLKF
jgi:hypothetical protein